MGSAWGRCGGVHAACLRRGPARGWRPPGHGKAGGWDGAACWWHGPTVGRHRQTGRSSRAAADAQTSGQTASQAAIAEAGGTATKACRDRAACGDAARGVTPEPCRGITAIASRRRADASGTGSRPAARWSDSPARPGNFSSAAGNRHEACPRAGAIAAVAVQPTDDTPDDTTKLSYAWRDVAPQQTEHGG